MRITPALIESAYQYTNRATSDRELRLRAYKIPAIENLGATLNQFDCIDFSDNDIRKISNFPLLTRLKTILLNNNRIMYISPDLGQSLPNLQNLILTNNYIQELGDIDALAGVPQLQVLSLINNPVASKKHYRFYVIHKLPRLRLLDFRKVKLKERKQANNLFAGDDGKALESKIGIKSKVFTPGFPDADTNGNDNGVGEHGESSRSYKRQKVLDDARSAIAEAQDIEAINRINNLLRSGYVPGARNAQQQKKNELLDEMESIANPVQSQGQQCQEQSDDDDDVDSRNVDDSTQIPNAISSVQGDQASTTFTTTETETETETETDETPQTSQQVDINNTHP